MTDAESETLTHIMQGQNRQEFALSRILEEIRDLRKEVAKALGKTLPELLQEPPQQP